MSKYAEDATLVDIMFYLERNLLGSTPEKAVPELIRRIIQTYEGYKSAEPKAVSLEEVKAKKYDNIVRLGLFRDEILEEHPNDSK